MRNILDKVAVMSFENFLHQGWADHAKQSQVVADRFADGIQLLEKNEQIPQLAQLIAHVMGEHLGRWANGIELLQSLKKSKHFQAKSESDIALFRLITTLEVASGNRTSVDDLSHSDQVRVLATAASALNGQGRTEQAQKFFMQALDAAGVLTDKKDPAYRALAITSNNLACALEEKAERTSAETQLMIHTALIARKYWALAGTWLETERAEYRLAKTYLAVGDHQRALEHANHCLRISQQNHAPVLELFFAFEAVALSEKEASNQNGHERAVDQARSYYKQLSEEDKVWCKDTLHKLT